MIAAAALIAMGISGVDRTPPQAPPADDERGSLDRTEWEAQTEGILKRRRPRC